jgi:hypothetical protein
LLGKAGEDVKPIVIEPLQVPASVLQLHLTKIANVINNAKVWVGLVVVINDPESLPSLEGALQPDLLFTLQHDLALDVGRSYLVHSLLKLLIKAAVFAPRVGQGVQCGPRLLYVQHPLQQLVTAARRSENDIANLRAPGAELGHVWQRGQRDMIGLLVLA